MGDSWVHWTNEAGRDLSEDVGDVEAIRMILDVAEYDLRAVVDPDIFYDEGVVGFPGMLWRRAIPRHIRVREKNVGDFSFRNTYDRGKPPWDFFIIYREATRFERFWRGGYNGFIVRRVVDLPELLRQMEQASGYSGLHSQ